MSISLSSYSKILGASSIGEQTRQQSYLIMDETWDLDMQSQTAYLYDYFLDNEQNVLLNLHPELSKKVPVQVKYVVTQYNTLAKDQVEYHVQFKDTQRYQEVIDELKDNYYSEGIGACSFGEFPIGLYVDIKDRNGNYNKWLICSRDHDQEFISYFILPCNYIFSWMDTVDEESPKQRRIAGVNRLKSSYNSGIYEQNKTTIVENQGDFWLPMNQFVMRLRYDDRFIIDGRKIKEAKNGMVPLAWRISKLENTIPTGLSKITVAQDEFNVYTDLYEKFEDTEEYYWFANYKKDISGSNPTEVVVNYTMELSLSPKSTSIYVGASNFKTVTYSIKDKDGNEESYTNFSDPEWSIWYEEKEITDSGIFEIQKEENKFKVKIPDNEDYLGKIINIKCCVDGMESYISLKVSI